MKEFDVHENGITYNNVSNINSRQINSANNHCIKLLKKINRQYNGISGNKSTITFELDLSEEEMEVLYCFRYKKRI